MGETQSAQEVVPKTYFSARSFESERYSDFDVYAAIGELIDNSIEAESTEISIVVESEEEERVGPGRRRWVTDRLAVVDNGHGMSPEILENCLVHGESTRYGSRTGIGRFGVGLVKGSISQCRRIDVFSRVDGGDWWHSYLDLDEIAERNSVVITPAERKEPPKDLANEVSGDSGTIVLWTKNDLMDSMPDEKIFEVSHWIGRTYRKMTSKKIVGEKEDFLAAVMDNKNQVKIRVNGELVAAYDPLFVVPNVDGDPPAELAEPILIPNPESPEELELLAHALGQTPDSLPFDPYENPIIVRMSLLPVEFREESGKGGAIGDGQDIHRRIYSNQGYSILRADREVYYGSWLGKLDLGSKQMGQQKDRYWGLEISFDPVYDELFSVKNIKVGAKPVVDLKEVLEGRIKPTVDRYRDQITSDWAANELQSATDHSFEDEPGSPDHDEETSQIADSVPPKRVKATEEQTRKLAEAAASGGLIKSGLGAESIAEIQKFIDALKHRYTIIEAENVGSPHFLDITPEGGKAILTYYITHPFFTFRRMLVERLQSEDISRDDLILEAANLRRFTDLMLFGFSKAYIDVLREQTMEPRHLLDSLMFSWSQTLRRFVSDLEARHGSKSN